MNIYRTKKVRQYYKMMLRDDLFIFTKVAKKLILKTSKATNSGQHMLKMLILKTNLFYGKL